MLNTALLGAVAGNIIEAAADLGGITASLNLVIPVPTTLLVIASAAIIFSLQVLGSYNLLRNIFRWLALALFAYVGAAILAKPDLMGVLRGTFVPHVQLSRDFISMIVACIGTSLSAYIYTWQSNQEVEEKIARGRRSFRERRGTTDRQLRATRNDVLIGMSFSNLILYLIILSTGATLHPAGTTEIESAAQAASALAPLAGSAASLLFALGVVGVGFLAVPVMTTGAAYDVVQAIGREGSLHAKPREAKAFYLIIGIITLLAVGLNFLGLNPMKALVWSGIVQGFSVPPLLCLIMFMTSDRKMMGRHVNGGWAKLAGWGTTLVTFCATLALIGTWIA